MYTACYGRLVGLLTLASRVLGFVRDVLIAAYLGTGFAADAWFVATKLPNLFRRLFAEGAFNSAFVPMFAGRLEQDGQAAARGFAERTLASMLAFMLLLTLLAEIFMPLVVLVFAPGFASLPSRGPSARGSDDGGLDQKRSVYSTDSPASSSGSTSSIQVRPEA